MKSCEQVISTETLSEQQINAAAQAYLEWQFPKRSWETASEAMKNKFREGARSALRAAFEVVQ